MSVTIVKPKAKVNEAAKLDSASVVTPEVVDEYAEKKAKLVKKQEKIAPLTKEVAALESGIIGAVDEVVAANVPFTCVGYDNEVKLGPKGKREELADPEQAFDMLGEELFFQLVKISIKDLKAYLTPEQVAEITKSSYAIKRRVKVEAL